jgi:hypothetical protein
MEDYSERATGIRDEHYNLVSVLYHALQSADTCDHYAMDAEAAGDERLAGFFRETQSIQTQVSERAKEMLGIVASAPEFDVGSGSGSGTTRTETVEWTETVEHSGRGFAPTADAPPHRRARRSEDAASLPCLPRVTHPREERLD